MLRVLIFVCLVGASFAHYGSEALKKKYAHMKIMSSCVGEETVMSWKMQMKAACDKCKGQDVTQIMIDIQAMLKDMRKKSSPFTVTKNSFSSPIYVPVPVYVNQQPQFPLLQQSSFRTKRSAIDLSSEGIEKMRSKMMAKVSNLTCVLKELNALDENNQPNYAHFAEEINNLQVDDALKEDFMEVMDMCKDFAMCLPVEKAKNPVKKELGTAIAFMKCVQKKKEIVCMKKDLKKYAPIMGFSEDVDSPEGQDLIEEVSSMLFEGDFM